MHTTAQSKTPIANTATVRIEKLVYGGEGLGRVDGQVALVPFVLPGEKVSIRTARVKSGLLRGSVEQVLQPAAERVVPRCEYFGTCGGCHYQHADYALQLEAKRNILLETLRRVGGIHYDTEIPIISGDPWFYRNRIQLHFANARSGFHMPGSHDICAIDHCYISAPPLVEVIAAFSRSVMQPEWPAFLRSLEVFTNGTDIQLTVADSTRPVAARFFEWCGKLIPSLARGAVEYAAAGHRFRISRGSFFQVNRFLIDALVDETVADSHGKQALDLYAGVGLFSLALAQRFESVTAVERGGPAFRDLEHNAAQSNGIVGPVRASAEQFLKQLDKAPELIIADPPRAGLGRDATTELLRLKSARLTLVSCDPATMARDVQKLLGSYRIRRLALIDLFPQTYHFETVVHLERE